MELEDDDSSFEEQKNAMNVNENVQLISTLKQRMLDEREYFERASCLLQNMNNKEIVSVIEKEYKPWFNKRSSAAATSLGRKNCIRYPSEAVEIISKVHTLRPLVFAKAISTKNVESNTTNDLVQDVRKQQDFMSKILSHHSRNELENEDTIATSVQEYIQFLRHAGGRGRTKCTHPGHVREEEAVEGVAEEEDEKDHLEPPSLMVDAIWHAHMQLSNYCCDSVRISGSVVDHKF